MRDPHPSARFGGCGGGRPLTCKSVHDAAQERGHHRTEPRQHQGAGCPTAVQGWTVQPAISPPRSAILIAVAVTVGISEALVANGHRAKRKRPWGAGVFV